MTTTSRSNKWKPKLLSSSLPLEYAVAKVLVREGFSVNSEYTYHRNTDGHDVQWSVDIRAIRETINVKGADRGCPVDLLVECKYRTRESAWLFMRDPQPKLGPAEFEVLRGVEEFTPWFLTDAEWWTTPWDAPTCYKGTEIDLNSGHVEESELRHGLSQLQFAIPSLIASRVAVPATSFGVIENTPFLYSAVLVTNAPLFVAHASLEPEVIEQADQLSDIAEEAECVVVNVPVGQDLFEHARRHFANIPSVILRKGAKAAEAHRKADGVHDYELPSSLARRISEVGDEIEAITNVSSVLVCRFRYLAQLLEHLVRIGDRVASAAVKNRPRHLKF